MKKILSALVCSLVLMSAVSASIIVQTQANTMGTGVGVGLSMGLIPMVADIGIEANAAASPIVVQQSGSYEDTVTNKSVDYDGSLSWKGSRYGMFVKFNFPFITPIIHVGTQQGLITLDGDIRVPGQAETMSESGTIAGSYASIGIPFYIGPVFTEISVGTQSLYIPHYLDVGSVTDVQLAFGLSFL